jgi:hypothetical protein
VSRVGDAGLEASGINLEAFDRYLLIGAACGTIVTGDLAYAVSMKRGS